MTEPINILYVDDYPLDRELVRDTLEKEDGGFQIIEAASRAEFETRLAEGDYDLVLSDFNILGFEGLQVIDTVRAEKGPLPVVILTGTGSEEVAVEAIKRGAADYVVKNPRHIRRLPLTLRAVLDRARAEEALKEQHSTLHSIINSVDALIFSVDRQYRYTSFNQAHAAVMKALYGAEIEMSRSMLDYMTVTEDQETAKDNLDRALAGEQLVEEAFSGEELRSRRYFRVSHSPIKNEAGQVIGVAVLAQDITERKQTEEALRHLNRELQAISDCNQVLVRAQDEQTLLNDICRIVCDEAGYRMAWVGYAEHDEAKSVRPVAWAGVEEGYLTTVNITWTDTERGRGPTGTAIRTGESACIQDFTTDPKAAPWRETAWPRGYRSSIALPLKDEAAHTFGALCIYATESNVFTPDEIQLLEELAGDLAFGITTLRTRAERARVEEALQEQQELLLEAQRIAHVGNWWHDLVTGEIYWSDEFFRILGREPQKPTAELAPVIIHPDDLPVLFKAMEESTAGKMEHEHEFRIVRPDGEIRWIHNRWVRVNDKDGNEIKRIGTHQDITERKRAEEALREKEEKYRLVFENSPVSIWEEDFSGVKSLFDNLKKEGVADIETYFDEHPETVRQCADLAKIVDVNRAALTLHGAATKEELLAGLVNTFTPESFDTFQRELVCLWNGGTEIVRDAVVQTLTGEPRHVTVYFSVCPGYEETLSKTLVSLIDITERKRVEEALRQSEWRYHEIFDNVLDGLYLLEVTDDGRFRTIDVNPALERLTGIPRSFSVGKTQEETVPPEVAEAVNAKYRHCVEAGQPIEEVVELDLPVGRRYFQSTLIPARDETGKIHRLIGISRDITERKKAEQERQTHLQFLECMDKINRVIQGTNDFEQMMSDVLDLVLSIFECDRAWFVYPCDPEAATWRAPMERTRPEYPGALILNLEMPIDSQVVRVYKAVLASDDPVGFGPGNEQPLPADVAKKFNEQSQLAMAVYPKVDKPYMFGIHQCSRPRVWTPEERRLLKEIGRRLADALSSLLMYRNLQESENRYRRITEGLTDYQYSVRVENGRAVETIQSSACETVTGYTPEEFAADPYLWFHMIAPEDRKLVQERIQQVLAGIEIPPIEHRIIRKDGAERWVLDTTILFKDASGQLLSYEGVIKDITERKRAEEEVRTLNQELEQRVLERTAQLEAANKELEAFAYSVSHDLRAPLRHIAGFLELLKQQMAGSLDERSRHYMDTIFGAATRMGQLIDDLLTFSRMGRNELSKMPVDLAGLVQEIVREFEPGIQDRTVHWRIADLPTVTGDRAMLRQVLVNLLANALKFTRGCPQTEIEVGCRPGQGLETVIFVRDNGVGFDMEYAGKLFGVFQRLHLADEFEGTGIGLANVRRIIHRHGGRVWAEGKMEQGATFYFSLP